MPRQKAARVDRTKFPSRLQDGRPVDRALAPALEDEIATAATSAADVVAAAIRMREPLTIAKAEIELPRRQSGTLILEGAFSADQIGAPVIVTFASPARADEAELGFVLFTGKVISRTKMRLTWFAISAVPKRATIHYIVGRA